MPEIQVDDDNKVYCNHEKVRHSEANCKLWCCSGCEKRIEERGKKVRIWCRAGIANETE